MNVPSEWLLNSSPWVHYRARLDLLGQTGRGKDVKAARQAMLDQPQVQTLVSELRAWPRPILTRHNDASHLLHQLVFIADECCNDRVLNEGSSELGGKLCCQKPGFSLLNGMERWIGETRFL